MSPEPQPERKPSSPNKPWVSLSLTLMFAVLTVQDQLSSGSIDPYLLVVDVALIGFWSGQSIEKLLRQFIGR